MKVGPLGLDPRTRLPSYKSLDQYLDIDHLRSLDGVLNQTVRDLLESGQGSPFYTGGFKRGLLSSYKPGSTEIPLSEPIGERNFGLTGVPEEWRPAPYAEQFQPLMEFIRTLPFAKTARILILADLDGHAVTPHRDHDHCELCHEFVWFRTNKSKKLWLEDIARTDRVEIESYSAWFDTVNQNHGSDASGELGISIRVDGVFTDEFRAMIPDAPGNPASLWASLEAAGTPTSRSAL